ncbi:hypothetical protein C0995_005308 [Termitomyces sp. Mi166|nr:hypothetical protein C0995_005308 [Termitomyces sp. Mi166\
MAFLRDLLVLLAWTILLIQAAPALESRASISALTTLKISTFKPYSFYAGSAYCQPTSILAWNCGKLPGHPKGLSDRLMPHLGSCKHNPNFKPVAAGGDGDKVQFWYVGHDPTLKTVVVGYQGTDVSKMTITYGMPRVGNQDFANYVDAHLHLTHINNQ